jgi:aconitate hydratase
LETYEIAGVQGAIESGAKRVTVKAGGKTFEAKVRIDTPREVDYYRSGGILPYVLRQLAQ